MNISKDRFCRALTQLKKANDIQNRIDDIMREVPEGVDFMSGYGTAINHECLVVELLEMLTNDEDGFIGWWCWEMDYGREVEEDSMTYDDKPIDLRTPEKLYDYLEKHYKY